MNQLQRRSGGKADNPRLSIVIPALNEAENIPAVLDSIPRDRLESLGYSVEILVVDNGSTDGTGQLARRLGARVIHQPIRGYGSAYKAGFANCSGDFIATADADRTYPLSDVPDILQMMEAEDLDFVTTNRLHNLDPAAMSPSHILGNRILTALSRALFIAPFVDSQSGMWVFRREVWDKVEVRSNGMAFSQELKLEAFLRGFRCAEVPVQYRPRGGAKKLRTMRDGIINTTQLFAHRMRVLVDAPTTQPVAYPSTVANAAPVLILSELASSDGVFDTAGLLQAAQPV